MIMNAPDAQMSIEPLNKKKCLKSRVSTIYQDIFKILRYDRSFTPIS